MNLQSYIWLTELKNMHRHQVFEFKELKINNHQLQPVTLTQKILNENYFWASKKEIPRQL